MHDDVPEPIASALERQAAICRDYGAPFYGDLLDRCARDLALDVGQDGPVARALAGFEGPPLRAALPLRLMGAVHALVLDGVAPDLARFYPSVGGAPDAAAAWPHFCDVLVRHGEHTRSFIEHPPQTNEVGRSAALLGGFLEVAANVAEPLALLELGASAGLNLHWDRFRYELGPHRFGPADAAVVLRAAWSGGTPPLDTRPRVASRRGCDLRPVAVGDPRARLRLEAYVWADHVDRLRTLRAAIGVAQRDTTAVVDARAAPEWIEDQLRTPAGGVATVVFHSVVWPYLSSGEQARVQGAIERSGRARGPDAPLAWLRLEEAGADKSLRLRLWPAGADRLLARSDPHGRAVEWLAG